MLDAMQIAFFKMFDGSALAIMLLGSFIGVVFGALPGLGGILALAVVLPFTFGMDPMLSMFLYASIISTVAFGGSVPAILLNTPGTPPNAVTCLDGYPMAKRGEGGRAIAISAMACIVGSVGGTIITIALLPLVRPIVFSFGPPEFFLLVMFGLVTIAFASHGNMLKGLAGGCLGLAISCIGFSEMYGVYRYTMGSDYLWDGIEMVPFIVGLFAVSEMIKYGSKGGTTVNEAVPIEKLNWVSQTWQGVRDYFSYPVSAIRSCVLGSAIGIIPGLGGSVAAFVAYSVGMQQTKDPLYGRGSPEGLVNGETANDAKEGGSLLPTLAIGIPGSADMAILLGAFILHGIQPGPSLLRDHLDLVYALLFGIVFSQFIASGFGFMASPYLARLSLLNNKWIAPFVLTLVVVGTFMLRGNIIDSMVAIAAGLLGFFLRRFGFVPITVAIGFILGPLAERAMLQSLMISGGSLTIFINRPISAVLLVLTVITLSIPIIRLLRKRRRVQEI